METTTAATLQSRKSERIGTHSPSERRDTEEGPIVEPQVERKERDDRGKVVVSLRRDPTGKPSNEEASKERLKAKRAAGQKGGKGKIQDVVGQSLNDMLDQARAEVDAENEAREPGAVEQGDPEPIPRCHKYWESTVQEVAAEPLRWDNNSYQAFPTWICNGMLQNIIFGQKGVIVPHCTASDIQNILGPETLSGSPQGGRLLPFLLNEDVQQKSWAQYAQEPHLTPEADISQFDVLYLFGSHYMPQDTFLKGQMEGRNKVFVLDAFHGGAEMSIPGVGHWSCDGQTVSVEKILLPGQPLEQGTINHWLQGSLELQGSHYCAKTLVTHKIISLWELYSVPRPIAKHCTFSDSIGQGNYYGPIIEDRVQLALGGIKTSPAGDLTKEMVHCISFGGTILASWFALPVGTTAQYFQQRLEVRKTILIDKDLLRTLQTLVLGKLRDQSTRDACYSKCRLYLAKTNNFSIESVAYTVELAMMSTLQAETATLLHSQAIHNDLTSLHSKAVAGNIRTFQIFPTLMKMCVGAILYRILTRHPRMYISPLKWAANGVLNIVRGFAQGLGFATPRPTFKLFGPMALILAFLAYIITKRSQPKPKNLPVVYDVCTDGLVSAPEQDEKRAGVKAQAQLCGPAVALTGLGLYTKKLWPVFPRSCDHNANHALASRLTFLNPTPDTKRWSFAHKTMLWLEKHPHNFSGLPTQTQEFKFYPREGTKHLGAYVTTKTVQRLNIPWAPTPFKTWLHSHQWSAGKKKELTKARDEELTPNGCKIDNFVKKECYPKYNCGLIAFKPRPISSRAPPFQSRLGPICYRLGEILSELWNGSSHQVGIRIVYCCGMTGQDLGREVHHALLRAGQHAIKAETDASTFDGSMSIELLSIPLMAYQIMGADDEAMKLLYMEMETSGRTRGGTKYWYVGRRNSGDADTSCGNSITNAITHKYLLHNMGMFDCQQSTIFVLGDDNLMILKPLDAFDKDEFQYKLEWGLRNYGMIPKMEVRDQYEFCSGLFYPVQIDGQDTLVWGPKIGRILYKTGFIKKDMKYPKMVTEIVGTFKGLAQTIQHIPILKQYLHKVTEQYGTKAIPLVDKYNLRVTTDATQSPETIQFVLDRYNISGEELVRLQTEIAGAQLPHCLSSNFDTIIHLDNGMSDNDQVIADQEPKIGWKSPRTWTLVPGPCTAWDANWMFWSYGQGHAAYAFLVLFIGPVFEEIFKTRYPELHLCFGYHEFIGGLFSNPLLHYLVSVNPLTNQFYPLLLRIFIHFSYNLGFCYLTHLADQLPQITWTAAFTQLLIYSLSVLYKPGSKHILNVLPALAHITFAWPALLVNWVTGKISIPIRRLMARVRQSL